MSPKKPVLVPDPPISAVDLAKHQAEVKAKDAPKVAALVANICTTCGSPVAPRCTCVVDGQVSP